MLAPTEVILSIANSNAVTQYCVRSLNTIKKIIYLTTSNTIIIICGARMTPAWLFLQEHAASSLAFTK